MKSNYLANPAFLNFSCDCCSQNTWVDNTRFGQWVDSGFKSKKKRDAEAAANLASAGAQINSLYGNAPSSSAPVDVSTDATNTTSYGGNGISDTVINKVAPNISFGAVPNIDSVISDSTNTQNSGAGVVQKPQNNYPTNYLYWGIAATVIVGGTYGVYHLYKTGKLKFPTKK